MVELMVLLVVVFVVGDLQRRFDDVIYGETGDLLRKAHICVVKVDLKSFTHILYLRVIGRKIALIMCS